jgi:mRNA-degrading endonuclease RelE of RelBE toxin-antitoxin system
MNYTLIYDKKFVKRYAKLSKPERAQVDGKLAILSKNPNHPSLRTKRVQGSQSLFEASVNMDIRIIWFYEDDKLIVLLDVGHHDLLRGY